jgi:hypothetical protein
VARKKSKPKKSDPPKMGRPAVLNGEEVLKLASYGHSVTEIADIFSAHRDTIYKNYFDKYTEGRGRFKKSVRLAQFKRGVVEGSDKMLIHIGKSNLDEQKPAARVKSGDESAPLIPENPAELERLTKQLVEEHIAISEAQKTV